MQCQAIAMTRGRVEIGREVPLNPQPPRGSQKRNAPQNYTSTTSWKLRDYWEAQCFGSFRESGQDFHDRGSCIRTLLVIVPLIRVVGLS